MSVSDIAQGKRQLGNGGSAGGDYPVRTLEVGDTVVGIYVGTNSFDSKYNDKQVKYHRFDGADGETFALRSKGNLDEDVMEFAEPGMKLEIERLPDKKTKAGYNFAQFVGFEVDADAGDAF